MPAISVRTNAAPGSTLVGSQNSRSARGALNVSRTEALALGITPETLLKRDWMFNVELAASYQAAQGGSGVLRLCAGPSALEKLSCSCSAVYTKLCRICDKVSYCRAAWPGRAARTAPARGPGSTEPRCSTLQSRLTGSAETVSHMRHSFG